MTPSSTEKYSLTMRILHWSIAIIILGLITAGYYMTGLAKEDPMRSDLYGIHKSFGALLVFLVMIRIVVRLFSKVPSLPPTLPVMVKKGAHAAHYILYGFMLLVPISGIAMSNSFGYGVNMFGISLPKIFPEDKDVGMLTNELHEYFAYTLLAIVVLHILAALKHRFFEKPENDVLRRML